MAKVIFKNILVILIFSLLVATVGTVFIIIASKIFNWDKTNATFIIGLIGIAAGFVGFQTGGPRINGRASSVAMLTKSEDNLEKYDIRLNSTAIIIILSGIFLILSCFVL